jgi:hypothetical protein
MLDSSKRSYETASSIEHRIGIFNTADTRIVVLHFEKSYQSYAHNE